ncbi:MAG: TonB-dependent receptor [Rickettsiales bacterium]|nr:TonB-dependent receptor [Rickettsiales bacterium]
MASPSSVYVITDEDLRQMGVTHLADALRTVPGLHVAKASNNQWVVSARGFSEQFSNKLLVLMDGMPVYSTIYSGVLWDQQDLVLEDIKQIEIIRGPGATLWGVNAVNGVINIVTKNAEETQGTYVKATTGSHYPAIIEARHGQKLKAGGYGRTYAKLRREESIPGGATHAGDHGWTQGVGGFRYDQEFSFNNKMILQGRGYQAKERSDYRFPTLQAPFVSEQTREERSRGFSLQGKWQYGVSEVSDLQLHGYVDYFHRDYAGAKFDVTTASLETQQDWQINERNNLIWGGGYTGVHDTIAGTDWLYYSPESRNTQFVNVFTQETMQLLPEVLALTLGAKVESSTYTDLEIQPSAKLAYRVHKNDTLWASVSRAVRSPSRGSFDVRVNLRGTPRGYITQVGDRQFQSEVMTAYEVGYKANLTPRLYSDITAFHQTYEDLRTFSPDAPFGNIALPLRVGNGGTATSQGIEIATDYTVNDRMRLWAGYSLLQLDFNLANNVVDPTFLNDERRSPQQQASLRLSYRLTPDVSLNSSLYFVDALPANQIPGYTKLDSNVRWQLADGITAILAGENLLDDRHPEFSAPLYSYSSEIPMNVYASVELRF